MHLAHKSSPKIFNTHWERCCFKYMPFGLKISQDDFQMKMDQIVEWCPCILHIHDDVCIYGHSKIEHNANLFNWMQVTSDNELVFSRRKCLIKHPQIMFCGSIFNKDVIRPDPEKLQKNHRDTVLICTTISRHAELHTTIYSMFVTSHNATKRLAEEKSNML